MKMTRMRLIIFMVVFMSGCASAKEYRTTLDAERQTVKTISTSMGQRTFDVSHSKLFKAVINSFSDKNLTVLTLEKESGYMMAEGKQFLSDKTLQNLWNERNTQLNSRLGKANIISWAIPRVHLRVAVNLYDKGKNNTLVKLKVATVHQRCMDFNPIRGAFEDFPESVGEENCPPFPTMVSLWYQQLWDEIEKSIFMQRETILN